MEQKMGELTPKRLINESSQQLLSSGEKNNNAFYFYVSCIAMIAYAKRQNEDKIVHKRFFN
jgi:hypothetical protein